MDCGARFYFKMTPSWQIFNEKYWLVAEIMAQLWIGYGKHVLSYITVHP